MNAIKTGACTFVLFLAACQKRDDTPFSAEGLNITIEKPLDGQRFQKGDTVFIKATAAYTAALHGYELSVNNSAESAIWSAEQHVHGSTLSIDTFWINDREQEELMTLQLTVEADHDGHQKTESRKFTTSKN